MSQEGEREQARAEVKSECLVRLLGEYSGLCPLSPAWSRDTGLAGCGQQDGDCGFGKRGRCESSDFGIMVLVV